jgi:SAM-dependent methyltransferase
MEEILKEKLKVVMKRVESLGYHYPPGYFERLLEKYSSKKIKYLHLLLNIGNPLIREHPYYKEVLKNAGEFLDYGCGTGDDIRALIRDGYPKNRIKGFDISWDCINFGFDIYMDKEIMEDVFVVSSHFPFKKEMFDVIYSGYVLHVLDSLEISDYLTNAFNALKEKGIFFGATVGEDAQSYREYQLIKTLFTQEELESLLEKHGFKDIKIVKKDFQLEKHPKYKFLFYGIKKS